MTAIGFALMVLSFLVAAGDPSDVSKTAAGLMFATGFFCSLFGVCLWLWEVMP